jgi:hypothetical protein
VSASSADAGPRNEKLYIHEFIEIVGPNRAKYMHHMTANWCPVAREERDQLCFGVWGTVGSTGRWPEVVNLWELDGWDGLVANFEHELASPTMQDPSLAEWWATAAQFRRGGVDRIVVPEPWTRSITPLVAAGVRGEVYAHDLVAVPAGTVGEFLAAVREQAVAAHAALGIDLVGAWRVTGVNGSEAIVLWALPSWAAWAALERAWLDPDGPLAGWRATALGLGADWRRQLLVDAPLSPLRTGRQPRVEDRQPLDQV